MKMKRFTAWVTVGSLALVSLAGCNSTQRAERLCTDPLQPVLSQLQPGSHANLGIAVSAQDLARCTAEALGKLKGYREETTVNGQVRSHSQVNINPLKVHMVIMQHQENNLEEVILIEGFSFAKVAGKWLQATEDSPDPAIRGLLNLPKSFQTQFNPRLRAAGTDPAIRYTLVSTGTVLGQPVLVLEAKIATGTTTYVSRYYVNKDYVLLRSDAVNSDGTTTTSQLTELDKPQAISNPMLPPKS
ncbi:MAG: hypothetical protein MR006_05845 [Arcanobacterium sp.]|nr:hypothetical protein [Arcanobacterium sp.]MDY5589502.1 hypothetical protein [Arcanobacterium sp.]